MHYRRFYRKSEPKCTSKQQPKQQNSNKHKAKQVHSQAQDPQNHSSHPALDLK